MVTITLKDGSSKEIESGQTAFAVAEGISAGLARVALAAVIDDKQVDMDTPITADCELSIITPHDEAGLEIIRHSTAHLLAQAIKELYPQAQITIGPVIEDGFYYDIALEKSLTPEDLEAIEKCMKEIAKKKAPVSRKVYSREEAIKFFEAQGEHYKVEIIKELPEGEDITLYTQGDFTDLCRGPHVPHLGHLGAFKLTKLSGAYWRADANNAQLQRVYGTAWPDKKALKEYLHRVEEAKKRDHRKLAVSMDLFHFQEEAPGQVFWHPNGWTINQTIRQYLRGRLLESGYQEINTPQLVDKSLWEASGHMAKFDDDMFMTHSENRDYIVKPMNCPCHIQVFNQGLKSYRDLPIRFAEYGCCHRNEASGTLHGLMRVRGFVQDDAHIFCTVEQIGDEVAAFIKLLESVYADFGFDQMMYKLSTRPEKRVGTDAQWDQTEAILAETLDKAGVDWSYNPGEGAFYGPKIEFALKDSLGRVWQCGTLQLDPCMPERLGATYIAEDGSKKTPYMLHRAIFGSIERFMGVLIEEYGGDLPLWLAPNQLIVMSISDKHHAYCQELVEKLKKHGFRVNLDLRNEKIGFKIREHTLAKIPCQLVVGDQEVENSRFALRLKDGSKLPEMSLEQMIAFLQKHTDEKTRQLSSEENN
jgi:threonyl-tRNA synthetase